MLIIFAPALCVLQQLTQIKDSASGVVKGLSEFTNEEFTAFQKQRKEFKDQFTPKRNDDGSTTSKKADVSDLHLIRIFDAVDKTVVVCKDCGEGCPNEISKLDSIITGGSGRSYSSSSIKSAVSPEMAANFKKVSQIIDNGYYFGCSLKIGGQMFYKALEEVNSDRSTFFKVVSITSYLAKGLSSVLRPLFKSKQRAKSFSDNELFDRSLLNERDEADRVLGDYVTREDLDEARNKFKKSSDSFPDSYLDYGLRARDAIQRGKVNPRTMPDEVQSGLRDYGSRDNIKGLMNTFAKPQRHAYKEAKRFNDEDVSDSESEDSYDAEDDEDETDYVIPKKPVFGRRPLPLKREMEDNNFGRQRTRDTPVKKQQTGFRPTSRYVNSEFDEDYADDEAEDDDSYAELRTNRVEYPRTTKNIRSR